MKLLVTATTYPRFRGDTIPGFVHDFASKMATRTGVDEVHVLVPHTKGITTYEEMDGVYIHRYRYWWPASGESITYGGAVGKTKKTPIYALKLLVLMISQQLWTIWVIVRYRIDILNAHWLIPMGFIATVAKLFTGVKVVITIHGGDVFSLKTGILTRFKRWSLKHANSVVVNSSATETEAKKIYDIKDYPIIPMGVDVDNIHPLKKVPRRRRDPLRLLFVGRLAKEKGVEYLLEAVSLLANKNETVNLVIAGSGPEEDILKEQVKALCIEGHVSFKGWVDHAKFPELFAEADIFVGPSIIADNGWQEAFGLVFAESLALNTPVISTITGGIVDIVKDGKNGFLVAPRDPEALASAIKRFIDEPSLLEKLVEGGRDDIASRFSWQKTTDAYDELFSSLVITSKER